jgi:3-oxoacyl-(acyl-carrier-protein) synthase/thioesterase domain-containing protein/NAD(P)-dependent dehydrogenase (short-subunit alcohol dehydrogenase family)
LSESSITQKALLAMQKLQARVNMLESAQREPIAIVGAGCRLPGGVRNPDEFWNLLKNGRDAIRPVPPSRWSIEKYFDPALGTPGKTVSRVGGYLEDVHEFDAEFFGISRREACEMDPQQRLLLETSWEAIENACIAAKSLAGSRTGVFVGVAAGDYVNLRIATESQAQIGSYTASSTSASVAGGRLAYVLGLHGPCVSIDTACSSSLAAIYLAVQSLRLRECDAALAGGVNLALSPFSTVALSQMRMLSPSDCCRPFDAQADGFVRGEGCVMLMLKRLSDAVSSGDPILAVIRGAAMNHDGRSGGLTAPNGPAQEAVMLRALSDAGCTPADVDWVETHGTGTQLGDPIEAQALGNIYGAAHSSADPLWISAVKSNIGHLECGAGAAAVLKAALALRHGLIPASLHFREPNPLIRWNQIPIRVATELIPIPDRTHARRAGVSSFGFSGTNVHLILEQPPAPAEIPGPLKKLFLPVSAKTEFALQRMVAQWADFLDHSTAPLYSVCRAAAVGRNQFSSRVVFSGTCACELVASMRAWLESPRTTSGDDSFPQQSAGASSNAPRLPLPTYPFSRHRHWFTEDGAIEFRIDPTRMPLLADHQIGDAIAVPAAVLIDLVLQAAGRWHGAAPTSLRNLSFANLLSVRPDNVRIIQIFFRREGEHGASWECSSVFVDRTELHAAGQVLWDEHIEITSPTVPEASVQISGETFYREHLGRDLSGASGVLGPAFQWVRGFNVNRNRIWADIQSAHGACTRAVPPLSPALLAVDAAFQLVAGRSRSSGLFLPFTIDEIFPVRSDGIPETVVLATQEEASDPENVSSPEAFLLDAHGDLLVAIRGLTVRRFDQARSGSQLLYRPGWRDAKTLPSSSRVPDAVWLCGDEDAITRLGQAWRDRGMRIGRFGPDTEHIFRVSPDSLLVFIAPGEGDGEPNRAFALVTVLRRLAELGVACKLWVVTAGTHASDADKASKIGAMFWAITRVCRMEHPEFHPRLLDLDELGPDRFETLLNEIVNAEDAWTEIVWKNTTRLRPSLVPETSLRDSFRARPDATYWITGGFGALGRQTALWLASRGAGYIALSGRTGLTSDAKDVVQQLELSGVRISVITGDMADSSSASRQLEDIERGMPPVIGVFHAAGVLEDTLIVRSDESQFQRVLSPKVEGALNLVSVLDDRSLDFLVFFSSISVATAPPGQAAYAAANAFLDSLAKIRNASGRRTLSVNWGPWQGAGMAVESDATTRLAASAGIELMPPERALSALGAALSSREPRLILAGIDRRKARNHPGLAALLDLEPPRENQPSERDSGDTVHTRIAAVLQIVPSALDLDRPLPELGVDSLVALELKQNVEKNLPRKLPLQDYLSGITVRELMSRLGAPEGSPTPSEELLLDLAAPTPLLYVFPGAVGSVNYLRTLANGLSPDYRLVGVQSLLEGGAFDGIPALASHCLKAIRSRQPRGPYCLAGHSFGGFLALEVAHQIRAAGESVGFLGLIDTAVLTRGVKITEEREDDDFRYVARVLRYLYCDPETIIQSNGICAEEELEKVVKDLQRQGSIPSGFRPTQMVDRARAAFRAMMSYRIPSYDESVWLFRAREPFPSAYFGDGSRGAAWDDPDLGWRPFLTRLKIIQVPGNHLTVVQDPHAVELGRAIATALAEQQTCSPRSPSSFQLF